jgi:hypothetical protein
MYACAVARSRKWSTRPSLRPPTIPSRRNNSC